MGFGVIIVRDRIKSRAFSCSPSDHRIAHANDRRRVTTTTEFSEDGAIHYVFIDWRHLPELLAAARPLYADWKNLLVWNKTNAGQGSFYRSKHELIAVFKNGTAPHINNFGLGAQGRYRANVLDYPGVNCLHPARRGDLDLHPTVKPVGLVGDLIRDCSRRNGIVLVGFRNDRIINLCNQQDRRTEWASHMLPAKELARLHTLDPRPVPEGPLQELYDAGLILGLERPDRDRASARHQGFLALCHSFFTSAVPISAPDASTTCTVE